MKLPKELTEDGVKMKKNKWWASGVLVGKLLLSCGTKNGASGHFHSNF